MYRRLAPPVHLSRILPAASAISMTDDLTPDNLVATRLRRLLTRLRRTHHSLLLLLVLLLGDDHHEHEAPEEELRDDERHDERHDDELRPSVLRTIAGDEPQQRDGGQRSEEPLATICKRDLEHPTLLSGCEKRLPRWQIQKIL